MSASPDPRRMVGDPLVTGDRAQGVARDPHRDACLYAAAMLRKAGRLPADLGAVDAHFTPPATIAFVSADARQAEVGRFVIRNRVLTYRPRAIALPPAEN